MFTPTIKPIDLGSRVADDVGSYKHAKFIDLVDAIRSAEDEEVVVLSAHSLTEREIGDMLGVSQQAINYRLGRIRQRANRCNNGPRCGCRSLPSRRSES